MAAFVALSTTLDPEGGGQRRPLVSIYARYLEALARFRLTPILITPAHQPHQVRDLLDLCSGLVLSGGEDVDPARYGEAPSAQLGEVNVERDALEWLALDTALERDMPVLGICRGIQVLNVYFGGTLYQDLATQRSETLEHEQSAPSGEHHHEVHCVPGSRLHALLGDHEPLAINSYHHQGVKDVGPGLRCTAEAADGLIEGLESERHGWVVGVQWHPERHEAEAVHGDPNLRLLEGFAERVRAFAR